jgi:hypothetical protein
MSIIFKQKSVNKNACGKLTTKKLGDLFMQKPGIILKINTKIRMNKILEFRRILSGI